MKKTALVLSLFTGLILNLPAFAADPPTTAATTNPAEANKAEWMKLTQPTENHKALGDIVGKWNFNMKWWQTPEAKPQESKGTASNKWIFGGRFVQQDAKSKMGGQKFEGVGYTGYDNVKGEYQSVWMDNMSTGMMISNGSRDTASNTLTESGTFACPMTGDKAKWFRNELKIVDKNEHVFAMFAKTADGKEYKTMEITYKRAN